MAVMKAAEPSFQSDGLWNTSPKHIFREGDTFLHNERTGPFPCTTVSLCSTETRVSSYFTHLCIYIHRLTQTRRSEKVRDFPVFIRPSISSVAIHGGLNQNPDTHTYTSGGLWKVIKSETWLRPQQPFLESAVKQYFRNSAHRHGPPLTFNLLCQQGWPAGMQETDAATQGEPSGGPAAGPLKRHLALVPRISDVYVYHTRGSIIINDKRKEDFTFKARQVK